MEILESSFGKSFTEVFVSDLSQDVPEITVVDCISDLAPYFAENSNEVLNDSAGQAYHLSSDHTYIA